MKKQKGDCFICLETYEDKEKHIKEKHNELIAVSHTGKDIDEKLANMTF